MKRFDSYSRTNVYEDSARLPPGGYVIGIIEVSEKSESWGDVLELKFDIAEGEHRGFYTEQYNGSRHEGKRYRGVYRMRVPKEDGSERDGWTIKRFNTDMLAIEESNPGFEWDWDERKLTGRLVGALFHEREYDIDGRKGTYTALHSLRAAGKVRSGDFTLPEPRLLGSGGETQGPEPQGYSPPDYAEADLGDGDLPF